MNRARGSGTRWRWLCCLGLVVSLVAGAEDKPAAPVVEIAPVTLDGIVLFKLRGALAFPATERARTISERVAEFAANRAVPTSALKVKSIDDRTMVQAGDQTIVTLVDADAAFEGLTREQVAEIQLRQIARGVDRYRADRTSAALWGAALKSVVASLALVALIFGVRRLLSRLNAAADRHYQRRIGLLKAETRKIVQVERLRATLHGLFGVASTLAQIALVLLSVEFILGQWPWTRPFSEKVLSLVLDPLRAIGVAIVDAIPGLVFIGILVLLTSYVLKVARLFFAGIAEGTVTLENFDQDWAWPTYRIVRFLTVAFAIVVAYPYIPGSDSLAFKGISVFLGVLFSLGSTSLVANLVAGYALVYRRAFKVGDRVRIGDHYGDVIAMRLQVTNLRSLKNEEIVIPNSVVLNTGTINYSTQAAERGLILHTTVGIGYETPWRQVEAMLLEAAARTSGLLKEPSPFVLQKNLGDFCVTYELNVYSDTPQHSERLYTELHRHILDVFNEHQVQIMTPAYVADPAAPKVVARDDWFLAPAQKNK